VAGTVLCSAAGVHSGNEPPVTTASLIATKFSFAHAHSPLLLLLLMWPLLLVLHACLLVSAAFLFGKEPEGTYSVGVPLFFVFAESDILFLLVLVHGCITHATASAGYYTARCCCCCCCWCC